MGMQRQSWNFTAKRRFIIKFLIVVAIIAVGYFFYVHRQNDEQAYYVSSEECADCHENYYRSWREQTLHPIMFRPVESEEDIQGDFSADNPIVNFKKEDIEFVIGNKWEQVYARMIDGEYYPLTAKWLITTQQWIPYKVNSWKDTPLSTKCNGCHTTGFNPDTYEFNEFGIGCEACHGPGSKHVLAKRKMAEADCVLCHARDEIKPDEHHIIKSFKNSVCGQCHSRGNQVNDSEHLQTSFRFPLKYKPGDELPVNYLPVTQEQDKKGKYWWKMGVSKNRHQEFADFSVSKHNRALEFLKSKHTDMRGELTDQCLLCHSADYRLANEADKPTLETAKMGLSCVVCHEPHGMDRKSGSLKIGAERCGLCHADSISIKAAETGRPHTPCPPSASSCADCHMPYIVQSGGAFPIRSHAFRIVPPKATEEIGIPNSCQNGGCHENQSLAWAKQAFDLHYPDFTDQIDNEPR